MRAVVDPRFAARRIEVREGWARRRLRWLATIIGAVIVVAVGYALLQSPWLAIRTVAVEGAANAGISQILEDHSVHAGMPTVAVRPAALEDALRTDPWVADVDVVVTWPGSLEIRVLERQPAAWARTTTGWALIAFDGMLLELDVREGDAPALLSDTGPRRIGEMISDEDQLGALNFLGLLPPDLAVAATAEVLPTGIEATVAGHRVLVGNGRDIPDKVATLVAILQSDAAEHDGVINVVSPTRPGIHNPQPVVEGEAEEVSSSENSG